MKLNIISYNELVIDDTISSITEYQELKKVIEDMLRDGDNTITIRFPNSFSITSSVIGYFLKLVYQDEIKLTVIAGNDRLLSLIDDLRLTEAFNAHKG